MVGLPRNIKEALAPLSSVPRSALAEHECEGAQFHSPRPLVLHEIVLGNYQGPTVKLCGVCRDNLHIYREIAQRYDGDIPWPVRREFGNQIRAIGEEDWKVSHGG